jgi:RNA polymerase sigma-70 factor (ECF subfamily)
MNVVAHREEPSLPFPVSHPTQDLPDEIWIERLAGSGPLHIDAVARLHTMLLRVARHRVNGMPEAARLGHTRREEVVHAAADAAVVSLLGRLDTFEGRSKFTTWAYRFAVLHAGVEIRRAVWKGREITLEGIAEPMASYTSSPEAQAEGKDLAAAVNRALTEALTHHQRRIAVALLVDQVPIDVLAERLGSTRGALYKTLHDARCRLRAHLCDQGYLPVERREGAHR